MTHGDWIRAKSDEGLALWLWGRMVDAEEGGGCWLQQRLDGCPHGTEMSCAECLRTWLEEEQEESKHG